MSADPCELCHGRGSYVAGIVAVAMLVQMRPCPRCLSVPLTPAIYETAHAALGFDPWDGVLANQGEEWWDGAVRVLPLWLPGGRHIAAAVIGWRFGYKFTSGTIVEFDAEAPATLFIQWATDEDENRLTFEPEPVDPGYGPPDAVVPALADIPDDLPMRTQIALALRHTLEATEKP